MLWYLNNSHWNSSLQTLHIVVLIKMLTHIIANVSPPMIIHHKDRKPTTEKHY